MASKIQLKTYDNGYSLVIDGTESEAAAYGDVLEVEVKGKKYLAIAESQGEEVESLGDHWVYEVKPVEDVEIVEAEAGDDDDEDDDNQGDQDDDDDDDDDEDEVLPEELETGTRPSNRHPGHV